MQREEALRLVQAEVIWATEHYPPIRSWHEGYAIILEELDEVWDEVRHRCKKTKKVQHELLQVAAMAIRTLIDVEGDTSIRHQS